MSLKYVDVRFKAKLSAIMNSPDKYNPLSYSRNLKFKLGNKLETKSQRKRYLMFVIIIIKCKLCILHLSDNIINSKILIDYWLYVNELFELINIRQILLSKRLSLLGALVKNCFLFRAKRISAGKSICCKILAVGIPWVYEVQGWIWGLQWLLESSEYGRFPRLEKV